jgi:beta-1,2-rhamnosyltransferase WsaF-like protein
MPPFREFVKRALPTSMREALATVRDKLAFPLLEDIVLHGYEFIRDPVPDARLSLVIPTILPRTAFGGVVTGIEIFLEIGKRTGVDLRILLDDFEAIDLTVVEKCALRIGLEFTEIEVVPRRSWVPRVPVRANDVFCTFNWWTTLNIIPLIHEQGRVFGGSVKPCLYIIQEYEPMFYRMSSTHMMARAAFEPASRCWGLFNSSELYAFFKAQGHRMERTLVFEPKISRSMLPFLTIEAPIKTRQLLVYGRASVPRNCFPAIEKGLQLWAQRYPEFSDWKVLSAGLPHPPIQLGPHRVMTSLGKLSLEDYAKILRSSAVGLSLMASPHPSYPPLEMAHFGLRTITNSYANKDLSTSHPNILSIRDITPDSIADALAQACRAFEAEPAVGWAARSNRPSFLDAFSDKFHDELVELLKSGVWPD